MKELRDNIQKLPFEQQMNVLKAIGKQCGWRFANVAEFMTDATGINVIDLPYCKNLLPLTKNATWCENHGINNADFTKINVVDYASI